MFGDRGQYTEACHSSTSTYHMVWWGFFQAGYVRCRLSLAGSRSGLLMMRDVHSRVGGPIRCCPDSEENYDPRERFLTSLDRRCYLENITNIYFIIIALLILDHFH